MTMTVLRLILQRFSHRFGVHFYSIVVVPIIALFALTILMVGMAFVECWINGGATHFRWSKAICKIAMQ